MAPVLICTFSPLFPPTPTARGERRRVCAPSPTAARSLTLGARGWPAARAGSCSHNMMPQTDDVGLQQPAHVAWLAHTTCSVAMDQARAPIEAGHAFRDPAMESHWLRRKKCQLDRDFGLESTTPAHGSRSSKASMWLADLMPKACNGVFRCCGVHVLCSTKDGRNTTCPCKRADTSDTRPFEARASSCELLVRTARSHLPNASSVPNCVYRHRSRTRHADLARRMAASRRMSGRPIVSPHQREACGPPQGVMVPFEPPLATRCAVE